MCIVCIHVVIFAAYQKSYRVQQHGIIRKVL